MPGRPKLLILTSSVLMFRVVNLIAPRIPPGLSRASGVVFSALGDHFGTPGFHFLTIGNHFGGPGAHFGSPGG